MDEDNKEKIDLIVSALKDMFEKTKYIDFKRSIKIIGNKRILNIKIDSTDFGSKELYIIAQCIKYCEKYKYFKYSVKIDLQNVKFFNDKISCLLLDMMVFYFVNVCKTSEVSILYNIPSSDFNNCTLYSTAFQRFYHDNPYKNITRDDFNTFYLKSKDTRIVRKDMLYYRQICTKSEFSKDYVSKLSTDINSILSRYFDNLWVNDICKVVEEIVDNALSHNDELLVFDLHCSNELVDDCKTHSCNGIYIGILNMGNKNLYTSLSNNIKGKKYKKDDKIYEKVYLAYDNHKEKYSKDYNENLFFMVTSFQKNVTSRYIESGNSGKGLTTLIKKIANKMLQHNCYVLSGEDIIYFRDEFLKISSEGFIGFNKTNDYINDIPDDLVLNKSKLYCPGTIYNLSFIKEEKGDKSEENKLEV